MATHATFKVNRFLCVFQSIGVFSGAHEHQQELARIPNDAVASISQCDKVKYSNLMYRSSIRQFIGRLRFLISPVLQRSAAADKKERFAFDRRHL